MANGNGYEAEKQFHWLRAGFYGLRLKPATPWSAAVKPSPPLTTAVLRATALTALATAAVLLAGTAGAASPAGEAPAASRGLAAEAFSPLAPPR